MQGQSIITEEKIRGFGSFFTQQLTAVAGIARRMKVAQTYFHFDLHGGSGFNSEVGVIGSPVLFNIIAQQATIPTCQHASEIDRSRALELVHATREVETSFVVKGSNSELVETIPDIVDAFGGDPRMAFGSILIDPNNQGSNQIPWEPLKRVTKECPRIDIAFNFPATAMKRVGRKHVDYVHIDCIPKLFNKRHWLIRKPLGCWQFTLLVGRNYEMGNHRAINLEKWDSPAGHRYRTIAGCTRDEQSHLRERLLF